MYEKRERQTLVIEPGEFSLEQAKILMSDKDVVLKLSDSCLKNMERSVSIVKDKIKENKSVYGVNTGFGRLANTQIPVNKLKELQRNLVISHCTGVGDVVEERLVRLIAAIKVNSISMGYSGVRKEVLDLLLDLINKGYVPMIPCQGSVGASGDLSPLAHLVAPIIGFGYVIKSGKIKSGREALEELGIEPIELEPLEGLALLNGTQVSTAFAIKAYLDTDQLLMACIASGAMSTDSLRGSTTPFRNEIHILRRQVGQQKIGKALDLLLRGSEIRDSHTICERVQDPYSVRCQPQVIGACWDQLDHVKKTLINEMNAVTNNPIVLPESGEILSGGNFHAEPVAFVADILAMVICEISSISERKISLLVDPNFSQLPAFLVSDSGLNSGFMIAQVTAAALVSENKSLSHPCSVDSIPTSANQEDHVSMATHAARRLHGMAKNTANVIAIELLCAAQGLDFLRPKKTSPSINSIYINIRNLVDFYSCDRYLADDINEIKNFVFEYEFCEIRSLLE